MLWQKRFSRVAFIPDSGVYDATRQHRAGFDVVVIGVEILVDLSQTTVHVPQQYQAQRRGRAQHAWKAEEKYN